MALADGAAALTEVQARLLQAQPDAFTPRTLDNAFNNLPPSKTRLSDGRRASRPACRSWPRRTERACMTLPVGKDSQAGLRIDPTAPAGAPVRGDAAVPGGVQADFVLRGPRARARWWWPPPRRTRRPRAAR